MAKFPADGDGTVTGFAPVKTAPVNADRVLIADSEAAYDGALVSLGNLIPLGWRDIIGNVIPKNSGGNTPAFTQIQGNFWAYKFVSNDKAWFIFHVPHDIASDDVYFHVHWLTDGTAADTVTWDYEVSHAKGYDQEAFDFTTLPGSHSGTLSEATSGTAYQHMITESAVINLPTLTEPDGLIMVYLQRTDANFADSVFLLTADIHYLSDSGSTAERNYPFT